MSVTPDTPLRKFAVTLACMPVDADLAKRLTKAARSQAHWLRERNILINEAYEAGGGAREIARLVGLTHPAILKIVGKPAPRRYPGRSRTTLSPEEWEKEEAERMSHDDGT